MLEGIHNYKLINVLFKKSNINNTKKWIASCFVAIFVIGALLAMRFVEDGFIGYFDEFGVQYTDSQGRSLMPFEDGADIVLYAKYKEEST